MSEEANAIALIKELAEENKRIQADTVRKMQEKAKEIVGDLVELLFDDSESNCIVPNCHKPDSIDCWDRICIDENKSIWLSRVDRIAEEMLEGEK